MPNFASNFQTGARRLQDPTGELETPCTLQPLIASLLPLPASQYHFNHWKI